MRTTIFYQSQDEVLAHTGYSIASEAKMQQVLVGNGCYLCTIRDNKGRRVCGFAHVATSSDRLGELMHEADYWNNRMGGDHNEYLLFVAHVGVKY